MPYIPLGRDVDQPRQEPPTEKELADFHKLLLANAERVRQRLGEVLAAAREGRA